jgi:hypothetical protein
MTTNGFFSVDSFRVEGDFVIANRAWFFFVSRCRWRSCSSNSSYSSVDDFLHGTKSRSS